MRKVLVIDDEYVLTEILRAVLEDAGLQVTVAGNGREGLARLETVKPDLVLCDVMMPQMDGREVCRAIKANPAYADLPIVMMTAAPGSLARADCPYSSIISKPFDLDALLDLIWGFLSGLPPAAEVGA